MRMVFVQIFVNAFQIVGGRNRPADAHLRLNHPGDSGIHFFFLDELTPGRGVQTFFDSRAETRILR